MISARGIAGNLGQFAAITGRSGMGKSTILKLFMGIFRTEDGGISASAGRWTGYVHRESGADLSEGQV